MTVQQLWVVVCDAQPDMVQCGRALKIANSTKDRLLTVARQDGWRLWPDGRALCPSHTEWRRQ